MSALDKLMHCAWETRVWRHIPMSHAEMEAARAELAALRAALAKADALAHAARFDGFTERELDAARDAYLEARKAAKP